MKLRSVMRPVMCAVMKSITQVRQAAGGAGPDAAISALFANGELGVWYDPSRGETLFQDNKGSAPVTAAGQSVGLMLDLSRNLALGPNAATQSQSLGDGWTTPSTGVFTLAVGGTGSLNLGDGSNVPDNEFAKVEFVVESFTGSSELTCELKNFSVVNINTTGSYSFIVYAGNSNVVDLTFTPQDDTVGATIRDVVVQHVAGKHVKQDDPSARPVYREADGLSYLEFDGVDDVLSSSVYDWSTTDQVSVLAGFLKTDRAVANNNNPFVISLGYIFSSFINGVWGLTVQDNGSTILDTKLISRGTETASNVTTYPDGIPVKDVVWGEAEISTPYITTFSFSGNDYTNTDTQGTGNYGSSSSIAMGGTPFQKIAMNLYCAVARGTLSTESEREAARLWAAAKTGVTP